MTTITIMKSKNGEYKREEQEVTYYYQKKIGEIEVNYLELGTEKVLATLSDSICLI